mmetsp:Transcript_30999/g.98986  ORF Transcript_30999/g.98986 Transcript_30999/m.98986 type:complete len:234 (-) Transcript_30999:986-1687(-)
MSRAMSWASSCRFKGTSRGCTPSAAASPSTSMAAFTCTRSFRFPATASQPLTASRSSTLATCAQGPALSTTRSQRSVRTQALGLPSAPAKVRGLALPVSPRPYFMSRTLLATPAMAAVPKGPARSKGMTSPVSVLRAMVPPQQCVSTLRESTSDHGRKRVSELHRWDLVKLTPSAISRTLPMTSGCMPSPLSEWPLVAPEMRARSVSKSSGFRRRTLVAAPAQSVRTNVGLPR